MSVIQFGVFDHLDHNGLLLADFYEQRLKLAEAYDRVGIHVYLTAEHHATPLGMSPSPSVFHSAVAQRTRRLKFGPLVYTLALYHPLRLAEEICMLDHMSRGRFQLGVGRGISPYELQYYGVDPQEAHARYVESFQIVMNALKQAQTDQPQLSFTGQFYQFDQVPLSLTPFQNPHPPLWYGIGDPNGVDWCVANRCNVVGNAPLDRIRVITDRYRQTWVEAGHDLHDIPLMGTTRHIVIGRNEHEAHRWAREAYSHWHRSFMHLWNINGTRPGNMFPADWDELVAAGRALAGTPETVREELLRQIEVSGVNFILTRFAFGTLPFEQSLQSVELFAQEVMPYITERLVEPQAH